MGLDERLSALEAKVDRIIAMVEERMPELKASAVESGTARKTVSPLVTMLLAKSGVEGGTLDDAAAERMLRVLTVEQRIAVKAELAKAGLLA